MPAFALRLFPAQMFCRKRQILARAQAGGPVDLGAVCFCGNSCSGQAMRRGGAGPPAGALRCSD